MWLGSHGLTRARLTQVMNLLLLAPSIQKDVIHIEVLPGWEPITERDLRRVLQSLVWEEQIATWRSRGPAGMRTTRFPALPRSCGLFRQRPLESNAVRWSLIPRRARG